METFRTIGIGVLGSVFSAAVLSMLFPKTKGKNLFSAVVGVYLILSILTPFLNIKWKNIEIELDEASFNSYEEYGEDLTLSYFEENIKKIIYDKCGIEPENINIELTVDENKDVKLKKIVLKTDNTKGLSELEALLGTEIEVSG